MNKCRMAMLAAILCLVTAITAIAGDYPIVGTGQTRCYDNAKAIAPPKPGSPFYGQDAQHPRLAAAYKDNGDGTITDLNTGLMWVKARGSKAPWNDAVAGASQCRIGGHTDWRAPTIKELYSLINFNGGHHPEGDSIPYLDTKYFEFEYGDESKGERAIDCQDWSATQYIGKTMSGNSTVFGVNFADGRIKGYPQAFPNGRGASMYMRYVRGNPNYGRNDFHDNNDGTISDRATGLMWAKADSGKGMNWQAALAWVQAKNKENYLGHNDWRLPNPKELQSIVDYTHAPQATDPSRRGPAIDPIFKISKLADGDYPFFWTSTTHLDGPADRQGSAAIYIAFGRATGWMSPRSGGGGPPGQDGPPGQRGPGQSRPRTLGQRGPAQDGPPSGGPSSSANSGTYQLTDVHGAGAQRSDPKTGNPSAFPHGRGPQGDVIRINNFVRCVRG